MIGTIGLTGLMAFAAKTAPVVVAKPTLFSVLSTVISGVKAVDTVATLINGVKAVGTYTTHADILAALEAAIRVNDVVRVGELIELGERIGFTRDMQIEAMGL